MGENDVQREMSRIRRLVNKILKQLNNAGLDWTIQVALNSVEEQRITYAVQIHAPAEGLAPLTWVCDSWDELAQELEKAGKQLNAEVVQVAWHNAEIARCERLINYHKDKIKEFEGDKEDEHGELNRANDK